ncbi:major facilitator superfamily domain-containing protein [Fusarium flagelliforme]|uniref:major facilitator superfamily domain-containing protein n=1 Tax=Fusarium flagelliforme TaxID=2675880 RepID=UPI001E8CBA9C|nr:major facilitator superfamily domain-containing protein [Fusarium flagelliforme]KAH7183658.1 major facilitator superfamily domain-containing protein [Fusarium flagelliforme]
MEKDSEKSAVVGTTQPQRDSVTPTVEPILTKEPPAETPQDDDTPWSIWSPKQRKLIILTASFASLLSPLSSQIYLPSLDTIANDLDVTNSEVNLSITTFLILQAIAPTFTAQLSDTMGRRPLYMACFVLYMAANLGLALQNDYAALLVLRCFQSAGSSGTAALSNAVATDITTSAERGSYIVYAAAIPMLGPTLGPIIGGLLAQYRGWHSVFWFLFGLTGAVAIPMAIIFPETCREIVGNGSIPPQSWNRCYANVRIEREAIAQGKEVPYARRDELDASRRASSWIPNPFSTITLLLERECGFTLLYGSLLCCSFYATLTLIPSQFVEIYGFNELQIALCFIPFGVGSLVAAFNRGRMLDFNFRRHATRLGISTEKNKQTDLAEFPIERARLEVAVPTIFLGSACMVGFGWTLHYQTNLAGPLILLFVIAFCLSASLNCATCLMLDLYPGKAGTVTASNNLLRCLLGAGATAAVVPMIQAIGTGWTLTVFALLNIVSLPLLWYVMKQGPGWRAETLRKKQMAQDS